MRFTQVDLFGVYVAPISLLLVMAWVLMIGLRRLAVRGGFLRRVWHPALFEFATYVIILSSLTFVASHVARVLP